MSLDKRFDATLQKSPNKGGWTYVVMPDSAEFFETTPSPFASRSGWSAPSRSTTPSPAPRCRR